MRVSSFASQQNPILISPSHAPISFVCLAVEFQVFDVFPSSSWAFGLKTERREICNSITHNDEKRWFVFIFPLINTEITSPLVMEKTVFALAQQPALEMALIHTHEINGSSGRENKNRREIVA
jgi:hypothetical protein